MPLIRKILSNRHADSAASAASENTLVEMPRFRPPAPHDLVPTLDMNDGNTIPVIGWGMGSINKVREKREGQLVPSLVEIATRAINTGFHHLDTSQFYKNEEELGMAAVESGVPRHRLFITTKVDAIRDQVLMDEIDKSLDKLGVEYVDLYLINNPVHGVSDRRLQKMWAEMEAIKASGKARSIGVSNFDQHHLEAILKKARIPPAVNQIEFHPYCKNNIALLNFHRKHNIAVAGYGCLMPLTQARGGPVDSLFTMLAFKYGVSETEVGLRWALDQGVMPITTSANPQRLQTLRLRLFSFNLTESEIDQISRLGAGKVYKGQYSGLFHA